MTLHSQRPANPARYSVEFSPRGPVAILWPKPQAKPITCVAWKHVEMDMEYLLARDCTIRQEEVDAFACEPTVSQSPCHALGYPEHANAQFLVKFGKRRSMISGNNQHMPRIDGLNVHEGPAQIIPEHDTRGALSR